MKTRIILTTTKVEDSESSLLENVGSIVLADDVCIPVSSLVQHDGKSYVFSGQRGFDPEDGMVNMIYVEAVPITLDGEYEPFDMSGAGADKCLDFVDGCVRPAISTH